MKQKKKDGVFGVIFNDDRTQVLMVMRRDNPIWVLPGGGIEEGESVEQTAKREMEEETGCIVEIVRKVAEYTPQNALTAYTHLFEGRIVSGTPKLTNETQKIQFFDIDKMPRTLHLFHNWVRDALENRREVIYKKITGTSYLALILNIFLHPVLIFRHFITKLGIHINKRT